MKKFINDPMQVVDEMLEGFLAVNGRLRATLAGPSARASCGRDAPVKGKVGVVTGGGSGHKPSFIGYVGQGMLRRGRRGRDLHLAARARGATTRSRPSTAARACCLLLGNYAGDVMNFDMAAELARDDGIEVEQVDRHRRRRRRLRRRAARSGAACRASF